MDLKKFVLQTADGITVSYDVVTILNIDKFKSLYLVYKEKGQIDEVLIAKLNISDDKIYLENVESDEEKREIDNKLNERGIK